MAEALEKGVQAGTSHQALRGQRATAKRIGQRFNRLTIISHHSTKRGYNCRCDCGNYTVVKLYSLKTGRQKSCGCLPRKLKPNHWAAKNELHKRYRSAARIRGYTFQLSKREFFELIEKPCHYCGSPPSMGTHLKRHPDFRYNGIDRVDNSIGYTPGNCVPACNICNNSKSTLTLEDWLGWVKRIHSFQKRKAQKDV